VPNAKRRSSHFKAIEHKATPYGYHPNNEKKVQQKSSLNGMQNNTTSTECKWVEILGPNSKV